MKKLYAILFLVALIRVSGFSWLVIFLLSV